ncbi:cytochrome c oxidase assembly protein [Desulfoluna limicola]|uniref:Cytochrome c oxidase assembly protein n=1 Tax=Desulfoluna limicola TaxID=2810562 RepID=A0ABM7PJ27_9BACT|nr:cytochrome d ubiquinol oxidase subunit II [Desulfoluna limicola]BCS97277.1 cytochrome c oxidase assembly protein [Desulfoluna limicola]
MVLQSTWFFLWGLLWAIFFITDGFDFGVGTLYPFLGKNDTEKRTMIASIGPLWDGNEVWLLTAGGVTFAAFPKVYAVMFSSLYTPLMLILFALIIRGVSFEFRDQIVSPVWTRVWDAAIFIGSFVPALLFGVAFANIFMGIPFNGEGVYEGNLFTLLNPYGLAGGVLFVLLFTLHGALWLCIRTDGDLQQRTIRTARILWPVLLVAAVTFLGASWFATSLYDNYLSQPALFVIIAVTVAALLAIRYFIAKEAWFKAWFASCTTIFGATFYGIAGLFPNLFPSSLDAAYSLSAFNASSSPLTLKIMLGVVLVFIPLVIAYQVWAYSVFSHKVTEEDFYAH